MVASWADVGTEAVAADNTVVVVAVVAIVAVATGLVVAVDMTFFSPSKYKY